MSCTHQCHVGQLVVGPLVHDAANRGPLDLTCNDAIKMTG